MKRDGQLSWQIQTVNTAVARPVMTAVGNQQEALSSTSSSPLLASSSHPYARGKACATRSPPSPASCRGPYVHSSTIYIQPSSAQLLETTAVSLSYASLPPTSPPSQLPAPQLAPPTWTATARTPSAEPTSTRLTIATRHLTSWPTTTTTTTTRPWPTLPPPPRPSCPSTRTQRTGAPWCPSTGLPTASALARGERLSWDGPFQSSTNKETRWPALCTRGWCCRPRPSPGLPLAPPAGRCRGTRLPAPGPGACAATPREPAPVCLGIVVAREQAAAVSQHVRLQPRRPRRRLHRPLPGPGRPAGSCSSSARLHTVPSSTTPTTLSHSAAPLPNLVPQPIMGTNPGLHYLPPSSSGGYLFGLSDHESPSLMLSDQGAWGSPTVSGAEELLAVSHMDAKANRPPTSQCDALDQRDGGLGYSSQSSYPLPPDGYAPAGMAASHAESSYGSHAAAADAGTQVSDIAGTGARRPGRTPAHLEVGPAPDPEMHLRKLLVQGAVHAALRPGQALPPALSPLPVPHRGLSRGRRLCHQEGQAPSRTHAQTHPSCARRVAASLAGSTTCATTSGEGTNHRRSPSPLPSSPSLRRGASNFVRLSTCPRPRLYVYRAALSVALPRHISNRHLSRPPSPVGHMAPSNPPCHTRCCRLRPRPGPPWPLRDGTRRSEYWSV